VPFFVFLTYRREKYVFFIAFLVGVADTLSFFRPFLRLQKLHDTFSVFTATEATKTFFFGGSFFLSLFPFCTSVFCVFSSFFRRIFSS
jgi:hypothetical protein